MRRIVRPGSTAKIVRKSAVATIIHRAMHKAAFACATKAGPGQTAPNRVQKASTVSAVKRNVQMLFLAIRHAITSQANTFVGPATLV